ncbi:MAG: hypothetical protein Q8P01_02000 [bacterium]|nr:hypothetical protein [bacterium]MDP2703973.1 hypothetical protein [bacterium]
MTQAVAQREYKKLLIEKARIERTMRMVLKTMEPKSFRGNLLELAELGIRGGPSDLTAKFDAYLYGV